MSIDINDPEVFNEPIDVGEGSVKDAEEFFVPALPDDGDYQVVLALQESKGVVVERQRDKSTDEKTGPPYVMANFAFQVETDSGRRAFVFDNPTSIKQVGKKMSKLQAALTCAGHEIPNHISPNEIKDHVEVAAAQSPRVGITTRWEAQVKERDGNGKFVYKTVRKGQNNFPQNDDNTFNPEIEHDGQVIRAQAKVIRYWEV